MAYLQPTWPLLPQCCSASPPSTPLLHGQAAHFQHLHNLTLQKLVLHRLDSRPPAFFLWPGSLPQAQPPDTGRQ